VRAQQHGEVAAGERQRSVHRGDGDVPFVFSRIAPPASLAHVVRMGLSTPCAPLIVEHIFMMLLCSEEPHAFGTPQTPSPATPPHQTTPPLLTPPRPTGGAFARLRTPEDSTFIRRVLELDGRAFAVASTTTPRVLVYVGKSERVDERLEEHATATGPLATLLRGLGW